MAGNFPFAIDSLKSIRIQKKDGMGISIFPWNVNSTNPLISFSINENIFTPLMTGTIVVKDVGDWSNEMKLNEFDEVHISLNFHKRDNELSGSDESSNIKKQNLIFEIVNVKYSRHCKYSISEFTGNFQHTNNRVCSQKHIVK